MSSNLSRVRRAHEASGSNCQKKQKTEPKQQDRLTENEYLELAKSFQKLMKEKFLEIEQLNNKVVALESDLENAFDLRNNIEKGYYRAINELAHERFRGEMLAKFRRKASGALLELHSFVSNENIDDSESETESDEG